FCLSLALSDLHSFPTRRSSDLAQSQGVAGPGTFAKYWMHNGFLNLNDEKMAKSTGHFVTIRDLLSVHDAEALRLYLLSIHYRSRSEEHTSELQSRFDLVCRLLL